MDQAGVTAPDSDEFTGEEAMLMVGVLVLGLVGLVVVLYAFIACIDISILGDEHSILRCSRIRTCLAHSRRRLFHNETAPAPSTGEERSQNDMELGVMRHTISRDDITTTVSKRLNAIRAGLQTTERVKFLDRLLPSKVVVTKGDQSLQSLKEQNIIMSSGSDGTKDTNMEGNDSNELNDVTGYPICSICLGNIVPGNVSFSSVPCSHTFHKSCILDWLEKSTACPCCRTPMISQEDINRAVSSLIRSESVN